MSKQTFSRDQIEALTTNELAVAFDEATTYYDSLLAKVESDNSKKVLLKLELQEAKLQYVMLRARKFPHFKKIQTAA